MSFWGWLNGGGKKDMEENPGRNAFLLRLFPLIETEAYYRIRIVRMSGILLLLAMRKITQHENNDLCHDECATMAVLKYIIFPLLKRLTMSALLREEFDTSISIGDKEVADYDQNY